MGLKGSFELRAVRGLAAIQQKCRYPGRAVSSVGRASRLHREGRRFEPVTAHHSSNPRSNPARALASGVTLDARQGSAEARIRRRGRIVEVPMPSSMLFVGLGALLILCGLVLMPGDDLGRALSQVRRSRTHGRCHSRTQGRSGLFNLKAHLPGIGLLAMGAILLIAAAAA